MDDVTHSILNRFNTSLMTFELNPPEQSEVEEQFPEHREYLRRLFDRVPKTGGINLPEIQEEDKKGERGDRKSDFKKRLSPREYSNRLKEVFNTQFVINRVIVQVDEAAQEDWFVESFFEYDIDTVIIVGGESSDVDYPGPSVTEGNRLVKNHLNEGHRKHGPDLENATDYLVGNICISTRRRSEFDEPDRMVKKMKSGCDFFTTQIIAELESPKSLLLDLEEKLRSENLNPPPLFWSITPMRSQKDVNFLRWLGVRIPDDVEDRILDSEHPLEESLSYFENLWRNLCEISENLDLEIPMGLNISPIAIRNLEASVQLAERLAPIQQNRNSKLVSNF